MVRVFHTGDVHLEYTRDQREQERLMAEMVQVALDADLVVVAGDLVCPARKRRAHEWERNQWRKFLTAVAGPARPVVIVRGNHDKLGDLLHLEDLPYVQVFETPTRTVLDTPAGVVEFFALPFLDEATWLGESDHIPAGERHAWLEQRAADHLRAWATSQALPGVPRVVGYHGDVHGSQVKLGQPSQGAEPRLHLEDFEGFDLVCAAHIHLAQTFELDGGGAFVYCGSPWPQTFGEAGQADKGPRLHHVQAGAVPQSRARMLSYAPLLTFELAFRATSDCPPALRWATGEEYAGTEDGVHPAAFLVRGANVRVVVRIARADADAVNRDLIREQFRDAGALSCVVTPEYIAETSSRAVGLRQVAQATTWEQLLVMWAETDSVPDETDAPQLQALLAEIESAAGRAA